jgi:hypothetical protein
MKSMKKLLAILLIVAVSPLSAFDLDSLFVKSIGGPTALDSLRQLRSVATEGKVILNGQVGRFRQYFQMPDRFYLSVEFDDFSITQGYDGQVAWQQDLSGNVAELHGYEKREFLKTLYFESFAFLRNRESTDDRRYIGERTTDSAVYHEVMFQPAPGDSVVVLFDIETGLREVMTDRVDNLTTTTFGGDYRAVGGILWPFYSRSLVLEVGMVTEFFADSVKTNSDLDTTLFSMPRNDRVSCVFPATDSAVVMPIDYILGHVRVPVVINGARKAWFILDSGTSLSVLHRPVADKLRLKTVGSLPAKGMSGFDEASLVRIDSMSLGKLAIAGNVAGVLDLKSLDAGGPQDMDFGGLLGYDFLSLSPFLINYRDSTLTIYDPDRFAVPSGGVEVPFHLTSQVPTIEARLNGIAGNFLVDLGNAFGLIVHTRFVEIHGLDSQLAYVKDGPRKFIAGVGGAVGVDLADADSFEMGEIRIDSLLVMLSESTNGLSGSEELAGNIGNLVLENFRVLFDYGHSRLILYENPPQ